MQENDIFDEYATKYNSINNKIGNYFTTNQNYFQEYKVNIVRSSLKKEPSRILDYGCGVGRNLDSLLSRFQNSKIYGCDISTKSLKLAKESFPNIDFFVCDKNCDDVKFDFIFISNVFHHIPINERSNVINKLYTLLSDSGKIFVFEHNPINLFTRRIVDKCPYDKDAILLKLKEMTALIEKGGFKIANKKYTLFFPPFLKILLRFEKYLGNIPCGGQYYIEFNK